MSKDRGYLTDLGSLCALASLREFCVKFEPNLAYLDRELLLRSSQPGGIFFFAQGDTIAAWADPRRRTPMLAKLKTFSLFGIDALPVEVEMAVKESTHRVKRAIVNSGFQRPHNRVTINLAPACSQLSQREKS
ncbi:MAG: hypothetical protein LLF97_01220, partial [Planctomycetaceae bacterium]|nr:hypothetical protein [Planctomycetaceae bacterium]